MEGRCSACNRLIYDTEKLEELRDEMECQHCGTVNIIRAPAIVEHEPVPVIKPVVVKEVTTAPSKPLIIQSGRLPRPKRR